MKRVKTLIADFFWKNPLFGFFCIVILMMAIIGGVCVFLIGMKKNESVFMKIGMAAFVICFSVFLVLLLSVIWKKKSKLKADFSKWLKLSEI